MASAYAAVEGARDDGRRVASGFVAEGGGPTVSVVWQIAAGDGRRDYSDLFLDFGVACVGPGAPGPYFENKAAYNVKGEWSYRRFMRPFCEQVEEGHLLALKGATESSTVQRSLRSGK